MVATVGAWVGGIFEAIILALGYLLHIGVKSGWYCVNGEGWREALI